jgi:sensor c-di-GMP phosphodiesterase-like protein
MKVVHNGHLLHLKQLYTALQNQELQLYFMPQISMSTGEVVGVEALMRWTNKEFG